MPTHIFSNIVTFILGDSLFEAVIAVFVISASAYLLWKWVTDPLAMLARGFIGFFKQRDRKLVSLEIIPPKQSEKSPLATEHLFSILQKISSTNAAVTLELQASRKKGISYVAQVTASQAETIQKHLASYMPELKFNTTDGEPDEFEGTFYSISEIKQARHHAFPLQRHYELSKSDPVAFIAGSMAKLSADESITLQMVLSPHRSRWTSRLYNKILNKGHAVIDHKLKTYAIRYVVLWLPALLLALIAEDWVLGVAVFMILGVIWLFTEKKEPELTSAEQILYEGVLDKLGQPLFKADIRVRVSADTGKLLNQRVHGLYESLSPLNVPGFQQLHIPKQYPAGLAHKLNEYKFTQRLPSLFAPASNVLSTSELASIYHFPYGTILTEGMVRSHSKTLPAPLAMKDETNFDVLFGENHHHGSVTPLGLTADERHRHMYVIGGTGSGKTIAP